jgi:hypothetical protein
MMKLLIRFGGSISKAKVTDNWARSDFASPIRLAVFALPYEVDFSSSFRPIFAAYLRRLILWLSDLK